MVVRGPETTATRVQYPPDTEWLGIRFKPGVSVVPQPARTLVDRKVFLPQASRGSFRLNGSAWEVPDFGNADSYSVVSYEPPGSPTGSPVRSSRPATRCCC